MNKLEQAARHVLEAMEEGLIDDKWYAAKDAMREALAEQAEQRPQNCGTGYCSCIECPYEAEQAEQEPVAWLYDWEHEGEIVTGWVTQDFETTKFNNGHNVRPLYAAPVQPVDLTDEEELELARSSVGKSLHWLVAAVIAKLKEKNKC